MWKGRQRSLLHYTIAQKMQEKMETCHNIWGYTDWQDIIDDFKIHQHAEFKTSTLWKTLLDVAQSQ